MAQSELVVEAQRGTSAVVRIAAVSEEPNWKEVLVLAGVCYAVYVGLLMLRWNYVSAITTFGDNRPYVSIAAGIRHWDFSSLHPKLFWGLPYAMAALSKATAFSDLTSLLTISVLSSFATVLLANRLWGGWVASLFALTSREWMERSLLGGAEPLFLACIFGSFVAIRKQRWVLASFLAALGTIVRPMGVFALIGIGIALLLNRDFRRLVPAVGVGAIVGLLYVVPLVLYMGSALANVNGYDRADWNGGVPFGIPLIAIVGDGLSGHATKLNLCRTAVWILAVAGAAVLAASKKSLRAYFQGVPVEGAFFALYTALLFTYNSDWARSQFPRFAIPILPFVILAFLPWIPKNRALLWGFGVFSSVLSAAETVGFTDAVQTIRHLL